MLVPGKPFQPDLIFVGKDRNLLKSEAPERCFTYTGYGLTRNLRVGWISWSGTNTLAYLGTLINCGCKKFNDICPWSHLKVKTSWD